MIKINIGCGPVQPSGWVNVDGSNRAWLASKLSFVDRTLVTFGALPRTEFGKSTHWANLLKPWIWAADSVDAIYAGEILEHFTESEGRWILSECSRVLRVGGVLRVRVPDNVAFWRNYLADYDSEAAGNHVGECAHSRWVRMFFNDINTGQGSWLRSAGHFHKWMYDDLSLVELFREFGFSSISRMPYHNSRIEDVSSVEVRDDLIVEGVKARYVGK